jgi:hypothetical protein
MAHHLENHEAEHSGQFLYKVCIGVCVGMWLLWPVAPVSAAEPPPPEIPTVHGSAQKSIKSLRTHEPIMEPPTCGDICGASPRSRLGPEDSEIQMGGSSAFDLINDKRELRFKWQGRKEGIREHSLKVRVSRNRSGPFWEGRF